MNIGFTAFTRARWKNDIGKNDVSRVIPSGPNTAVSHVPDPTSDLQLDVHQLIYLLLAGDAKLSVLVV